MTHQDRFETQLGALGARMTASARQAAQAELSEELLLEYYTGSLPEEEAKRVGRLAALSPEASAYLAKLEIDAHQAATSVDRTGRWHRSFRTARGIAGAMELITSLGRVRTLSLATGALAAVLALVILVPPLVNGPPDFGTTAYVVTMGQGKSVETLPGGERVGDVASDWPLHVPSGRVTKLSWFVWQPVEGAQGYRLQVIGPTGRVIFAASPHDPHQKLPASARAAVPLGEECAWVVEALDAHDEVVVRGVGRFTLTD